VLKQIDFSMQALQGTASLAAQLTLLRCTKIQNGK
jgi:hypothetical protein